MIRTLKLYFNQIDFVVKTVGEASVCEGTEGEMIVGVPDGLGAYLYDYETVRAIVQSEVSNILYTNI